MRNDSVQEGTPQDDTRADAPKTNAADGVSKAIATPSGEPRPTLAPPPPEASASSEPARLGLVPSPLQNLESPELFINRELSWLRFNERVLEEALDETNPLLERVKFLGIFANNLDEFFMVRVSGLRNQMQAGVIEAPPDGMTPAEQLAAIMDDLRPVLAQAVSCWHDDLRPKLAQEGIHLMRWEDLEEWQRRRLRAHFQREIFPVLTPLAFDPGHPFPHISSLSLNLAVVVLDSTGNERFARLKLPGYLTRLVRIPEDRSDGADALGLGESKSSTFIWLEALVTQNLDLLFPGVEVVAAFPFRVTRDADLEVEEDEASDLLEAMSEVVEARYFASAVRLEVDEEMPPRIRDILVKNLELAPYQVMTGRSPIGMADLMQLMKIDRPDLKDAPFLPLVPKGLGPDDDLFSTIRSRDVLLHHPYDSFNPVIQFVQQAARDPNVLAIKQTLYRVGPDSPIVKALIDAREMGKQVSTLVELKARFDEENNIVWARALEEAGVHVVYGIMGLKTHAKMCLVVRREETGIRRYMHLATGNYNPTTARLYTDLGFFTADPILAEDVSNLFNALTGYSRQEEYEKLLVAPRRMRRNILDRIEREIEAHRKNGGGEKGGGYLAFKMNSLVDRQCIQALYRASQAGVEIDLLIRGICCLRPGIPGLSETIRVNSIVGRFLEHTRFFYFRNGGDEEVFVGSADLMPRNLDGRVEALFPIGDRRLVAALRQEILLPQLRDTAQARNLASDGSYERAKPDGDESPFDSQAAMIFGDRPWHPDP